MEEQAIDTNTMIDMFKGQVDKFVQDNGMDARVVTRENDPDLYGEADESHYSVISLSGDVISTRIEMLIDDNGVKLSWTIFDANPDILISDSCIIRLRGEQDWVAQDFKYVLSSITEGPLQQDMVKAMSM